MSARAVEFVETWVAEKIDAMDMSAPVSGDDAQAKTLAAACVADALSEGIPASEIDEVFDDLAAFIKGEIEEARDRDAGYEDEDGGSLIEDDDARLDMDDDDDEEEQKK